MTNRRKGGRTKSATPKKAEAGEKQTRRSHRRSRRGRKSVSPEESASDDSAVEETVVTEANSSTKPEDDEGNKREYESNKSPAEDQVHSKGEESGGSEGGWKVKSENGGSGGIPKLKLCLQRPPEVSSPTPDQLSPKRKKRTRNTSTPTKDSEVEEAMEEKTKSPKRATRSTRHREKVEEVVEPPPEPEPEPEPVVAEPSPPEVAEEADITSPAYEAIEENHVTSNHMAEEESVEESPVVDEAELKERQETAAAVEAIQAIQDQEGPGVQEEVVAAGQPEEFHEVHIVLVENFPERTIEEVQPPPPPAEEPMEEEPVVEEVVAEERRRSPSRDSSEERAKVAALMSRKKKKRGKELEEMETESDGATGHKAAVEIHSSSIEHAIVSAAETTIEPTLKPVQEEHAPVVRKRRWGSSSGRLTAKPPVSISTDMLREIIPEVKPISISEVQLSPNKIPEEDEEEEEGEAKDADVSEDGEVPKEDEEPKTPAEEKKQRVMPSDESEKDYEEEAGADSAAEEAAGQERQRGKEREKLDKERAVEPPARRVSVMPAESSVPVARSPSPPHHKPCSILFIKNLVRPFTVGQLRELLARTGNIVEEDGFWIDKIKSKCFVKYATEEEARTTRHALHGVTWPVSNPKQLNVDFGTEATMRAAMEGAAGTTNIGAPAARKEREERERERAREREERAKLKEVRGRDLGDRDKEKEKRPVVEPLVRDRTVRRVTVPVREWDVGKKEDGFSPPPEHGLDWPRRDERFDRRVEYDRGDRGERRGEDERRRGKDRSRRSMSDEPPRKAKKKGEPTNKLLDDLFRKTKATPCIYWLPLTAEQIAVKEEMRRKHMAEHEKKVAEMRKKQRDQTKRSSERRRRRSKSRSRSPKK